MKKVKFNKIKKILLYIVILMGIILLLLILAHNVFTNYHSWRIHHNYFKNNTSPQIESWMTINMISNRFNITNADLFKEISLNKTQLNKHMTLDRFCKQYKQNCIDLVNRLNNIIKK